MQPSLGIKGRLKVGIVRGGVDIESRGWQKNLLLNQGLNTMAGVAFCDIFAFACKGTGTTITTETPATTNKYAMTLNSSTLNRSAGTRDFTPADVGKLVRLSGGKEATIQAYTSATQVDTDYSASPAITNNTAVFYSVGQTGLDTELARTNTYSVSANENSTVTVGNKRTFQRTFVFPTEETYDEKVATAGLYSQAGTTVTRDAGTRNFTSADIGRVITFQTSLDSATIVSITDVSHVVVGVSQAVSSQNIRLTGVTNFKETVAGTNTYSRTGSTLTRTAGTRNFTTADIGKIVHFNNSNTEATITAFTSATVVTVNVAGALAGETILLFGFTDYTEFGFSHVGEKGANINIRVVLASALRVYPATPLKLSDQVKATYQMDLTVTPNTVTAQNLNGVILDSGNEMSSSKAGSNTIETFATSIVTPTGETDISLADLEPFYDGFAALSLDTAALAPLTGKIRDTSAAYVPMASDAYVSGSYYKTFNAIFGLTDAINTAWRSLMIFDPDTSSSIFCQLFTANQKKDGNHALTVTFKKSWSRDLS